MWRSVRWWIVLLLLPSAAAEVDLDVIAVDDDLLLSRDHADPRHDPEQDLHGGEPGLDSVTWSMRWNNSSFLDGDLDATARIGTGVGIWEATVTMEVTHRNGTVATGAAREVALGTGFQDIGWSVPVNGSVEGALWWNVTATGRFSSLFLDVGGNTTHLVLPTAPPPPPSVRQEERNVSAPSLQVSRSLQDAYLHQQIHWRHAPGDVVVHWNATLSDGSLTARLVDADGQARWERTWPEATSGQQNVSAAPGNWTLHVEAAGATGDYEIRLERQVADEEEERPRQRSPWPLGAALAALWIAARR